MINGFTLHDTTTAPTASTEILDGVQKSWGFVPNLHRVLAESPAALEAYTTLWGRENQLHPAGAQHRLSRDHLRERMHLLHGGPHQPVADGESRSRGHRGRPREPADRRRET